MIRAGTPHEPTIVVGIAGFQAEEITGGEFVSVHDLPVLTARERFCPDGVQVWAEFQRRNCIL